MTKKTAPTLKSDVRKELDGLTSISAKIRYLDKIGMSRGDISRTLNKRYQHVRNVLEEDKKKG